MVKRADPGGGGGGSWGSGPPPPPHTHLFWGTPKVHKGVCGGGGGGGGNVAHAYAAI